MSSARVRRCPRCRGRLESSSANCRGCGLLIHEADEVSAELVAGPKDDPARRPRGAPASGLEQALYSWGAWAGVIAYALSAIAIFLFVLTMPGWSGRRGPGADLPGRIHGGIYASLALSCIPAGLVWLLFDSVQAVWAWWMAPRPEPGGPDLRPRLGWLAGPGRLGVILVLPLLGALVALAIHPSTPLESMAVGGLAVGLPLALLIAFLITVVLWNV